MMEILMVYSIFRLKIFLVDYILDSDGNRVLLRGGYSTIAVGIFMSNIGADPTNNAWWCGFRFRKV